MVFTDSMQIPVGAPHAFTAEKFMDFVYDPKIMVQITAYVNYVPPVKGVRRELEKSDPELLKNKLIFPDQAKTHYFNSFSPEDEAEIDAAFQRAIGGAVGLAVGTVMDYGPLTLGIPGAILGALVGTFLIGQAFIRVTLPLALPGIFAGSLLTFIPAVGDFINAELLGTPRQTMIGNVIQSRYLELSDYPTAAALSFILMAVILVMVLIWAKVAGTESLMGAEGR